MRRIAITGTRETDRLGDVTKELQSLRGVDCLVILGDCPTGIDEEAKEFCEKAKIDFMRIHAHWKKFHRAAGPIRNKRMLVEGQPDEVWAFPVPNSTGTKNMMKQAEAMGIPVKEF
jgi:hypothetical protein